MTVFVDNYSGMKNVKCNLRGVYTRFHLGGNEILKNVLPTLQTKWINKIINDKHRKYCKPRSIENEPINREN